MDRRAGIPTLPRDRQADDEPIEAIGGDTSGKGGRVSAVVFSEHAGEPATGGHAEPDSASAIRRHELQANHHPE